MKSEFENTNIRICAPADCENKPQYEGGTEITTVAHSEALEGKAFGFAEDADKKIINSEGFTQKLDVSRHREHFLLQCQTQTNVYLIVHCHCAGKRVRNQMR